MNPKQMTLEEYEPEIFRRQSVGVSAHLARTSVLQGFEQDLTETEARWCERFSDSLKKRKKKIDPNGLSMRMLKGCCQAIEDGTLPRFCLSFTGGGMTSNGEYSTQSFSVSRRIGKECTLSDILEDTVDAKYFLSDTAVKALTSLRDAKVEPLLPPIRERERERRHNTDAVRKYVGGQGSVEKSTRRISDERWNGSESQRLSQEVIQIAMAKSHRNNPNQYRVYSKHGIAPCLNKAEGGGRTPYIYPNEDQGSDS